MIAYVDTSALLPLLIDELASERASTLWRAADRVVAVRVIYAEARSALAQAQRLGRLTVEELEAAVAELEGLYAQLDVIEVDDALVRRAGELAQLHALRGYDAVHLAAAERVADTDTVLVTGDMDLSRAADELGLSVASTVPTGDAHRTSDD